MPLSLSTGRQTSMLAATEASDSDRHAEPGREIEGLGEDAGGVGADGEERHVREVEDAAIAERDVPARHQNSIHDRDDADVPYIGIAVDQR